MFKKQLEIIPFLFSSQTDREAARAQKTEQYTRIKERERENGICPMLRENSALELPR
jgi:hypothetical protein